MIPEDALVKIDAELKQAEQARAAGNEGMARVCARRAAGIAIREYYQARGLPTRSTSAVDLLEQIRTDPQLPADVHTLAEHLLLRVTPEYQLPIPADLLAETRLLVQALQDQLNSSGSSPFTRA